MNDLVLHLEQWMPAELARVAVAAGVIAIGFVVATGLRVLVMKAFARINAGLARMTHGASHRAGILDDSVHLAARTVAGRVVFWVVFLIFLAAASTVLGFPVVSAFLASLAGYLPHVLAAVAIVLLGVLFGLMLRVTVTGAATSAGLLHARGLGRAVQIAVVALSVVVAIEELGIGVSFLVVVAATVLGAALGGAALAFGLGARRSVSNLLASHYLSKWYRVGHIVRIGEHEGRIAELLPSAVILHTETGKVYVPADEFARSASELLSDESEK